jgi:hypothetical protein
MAKNPNPRQSGDNIPESQWYSHQDACEPQYEQVISKSQAIHDALACLGPAAPADQVKLHLEQKGIHVEPELIEKVRSELSGGRAGA